MYYKGEGVKKDSKQAAQWFKKAADQGHANAKKILSLMDKIEISERLQENYANDEYKIGNIYLREKDYKQAEEWFSLSCNGGLKEACLMLKN